MTKLFDRSTRAGFTLVELIVVIAILGILAGIAIPVYSGYVEKTQLAADYVLLDAAKKALAAAALEHGVDSADLIVTLSVDNNHCIDGFDDVTGDWTGFSLVPLSARRNGGGIVFSSLAARPRQYAPAMLSESATTNEDALEGSFIKFFAENADTPLQTLYEQELVLAGDDVLTMDYAKDDSGKVTLTVTNKNGTATYEVTADQIAALNASTFGTNMTMSELMGDISTVVGGAISALTQGGQVDQLVTVLGNDFASLLADLGISASDPNYSDEVGNALVMYVAMNTGANTVQAVTTAMDTGISSLLNIQDMGSTLANVAAVYSLMTGYANSDIGRTSNITYTDNNGDEHTSTVYEYFTKTSDEFANASDGAEGLGMVLAMAANMLSNDNAESLQAYAAQNAQTDLNGYVNAMGTIAANADAMATTGVISDGFDSGSITAILNAIYNTDTATGDAGE